MAIRVSQGHRHTSQELLPQQGLRHPTCTQVPLEERFRSPESEARWHYCCCRCCRWWCSCSGCPCWWCPRPRSGQLPLEEAAGRAAATTTTAAERRRRGSRTQNDSRPQGVTRTHRCTGRRQSSREHRRALSHLIRRRHPGRPGTDHTRRSHGGSRTTTACNNDRRPVRVSYAATKGL